MRSNCWKTLKHPSDGKNWVSETFRRHKNSFLIEYEAWERNESKVLSIWTHREIYDDFWVNPNKCKGTSVPYLKETEGSETLQPLKLRSEIETFFLVLLPFRTMRWWSGEPVQEYLDVKTSLLVSASGPTWTNGQQRKNCLKPRRNLKGRRVETTIKIKHFHEVFLIEHIRKKFTKNFLARGHNETSSFPSFAWRINMTS